MESNQILLKERFGFSGILEQAFSIPLKNPKFIALTFLTSLPLFCLMLIYEFLLQKALTELLKILAHFTCRWSHCNLDPITMILGKFHNFLLLGILYLVILHLPYLLNTIMIVHSASLIHAGEKTLSLRETLRRPIQRTTVKEPLITSIYVLGYSSLTPLPLLWMAAHIYVVLFLSTFVGILLTVPFIVSFAKYMEWCAVWNTGIVTSILEEKKGDLAMSFPAYITKGNRHLGLLLSLASFLWNFMLRAQCTFLWWNQSESANLVTLVSVGLICLGNVMKWVTFTVYFCDCRKNMLGKKIDLEGGKIIG